MLQSVKVEKEIPKEPWYSFLSSDIRYGYDSIFLLPIYQFLILTWTPKYLQDVFHFQLSSLWYLGMIPWLGACITLPLGAKLSDRILRKTGNLRLARTGLPIIALLLTAICFSFIPAMNNYVAVLALMSLGNAFAFYRVHYFGQLLSILLLLTQEHIVELCISSLISRQS